MLEIKESTTVLEGISLKGPPAKPDKTVQKLEESSPKVRKDEVESSIEETEKQLTSKDAKMSLTLDEIVEKYKKIFDSAPVPDLNALLEEAKGYSLELPDDIVDSQTLMYLCAKNASYRNKLVVMQVNLRRVANVLTRTYKSMLRVLQGMADGSSADKRTAAAVLKSAKYEFEAGRVQDTLDAIEEFIENTDAFAASLRTLVKLFESPTGRMLLQQGGDAVLEADLPPRKFRSFTHGVKDENDEESPC